MPEFTPTPEQRTILAHSIERHARVLAGPGTGKSATLVALVNLQLAQIPTPRIKLLTFTRAATAELAKKISEHPATAADRPSTIHSFSISVLLRNPGAGDFPQPLRIADEWEYKNIVRPSLARLARVTVRRLDRLVQEMASNWESLRPNEDPQIEAQERTRFLGAWNEHRKIYGYTLLAELPYALRGALRDNPDLEGVDYDLLVVDEYQDLNACDLQVLKLIAQRGCSIIGAGDDDQSIYSFRRAAPEGIRRFQQDYVGSANYSLSVTQRCGSRIVDWATYVIHGDPHRPSNRPRLRSAQGSPPGEVALLSFISEISEARGIATLIKKLVEVEHVPPAEILVLLRSDYNSTFSKPIKQRLQALGIPYSDPDVVKRILMEEGNRRLLEILRLLVHRNDSLAWASLIEQTVGIGDNFTANVYERARRRRVQFGQALLDAYNDEFPGAAGNPAKRARELVTSILNWLDAHPTPDYNEEGWGHWIIEATGGDLVPAPSNELNDLLLSLDKLAEPEQNLGRYLGQISPLGKDKALAESEGVRIMSMTEAKGLTVRATIIGALEEGLIPRPDADLSEERRLLYVAMTRAKEFLYGTWARRRVGPTARAGEPMVAIIRKHSHFLDGGPVASQRGIEYIRNRWP
jgi:ATP-dependent DNA helicase UvrD/PcrA